MLRARANGSYLMSDPAARRVPTIMAPRNLSYDPDPGERYRKLGRIDPSKMEVAGAQSFCRRFDELRQENYRAELSEAVRTNEIVSAIRR
mmetsp:Transcript_79204/g.142876  ORF Transcript_79204/g.142876 Transcript_79204/m.142876 type:complete len:90 (+) Transcript_79204:177-446(+)